LDQGKYVESANLLLRLIEIRKASTSLIFNLQVADTCLLELLDLAKACKRASQFTTAEMLLKQGMLLMILIMDVRLVSYLVQICLSQPSC
jgi:hypothetical protein